MEYSWLKLPHYMAWCLLHFSLENFANHYAGGYRQNRMIKDPAADK